jgi:hypothetical protein
MFARMKGIRNSCCLKISIGDVENQLLVPNARSPDYSSKHWKNLKVMADGTLAIYIPSARVSRGNSGRSCPTCIGNIYKLCFNS